MDGVRTYSVHFHRRKLLGRTVSAIVIMTLCIPSGGASSYGNVQGSTSGGSKAISQDAAIQAGLVTESLTEDSDGATSYTYSVAGLADVSVVIPPAGFSPALATDGQLQDYGFPPRPSNGPQLEAWMEAMRAARVAPAPNLTFIQGSPISRVLTTDSTVIGVNGVEDTHSWAGWAVSATNGNNWYDSEADWYVPSVGDATCAGDALAIWTGLGGDAMDYGTGALSLLQSGVVYNDVAGFPKVWTPFWEMLDFQQYNNPPEELYGANNVALFIAPGNKVFSTTFYSQSTGVVYFYLEDVSTGKYTIDKAVSSLNGSPTSDFYNGNTAEMITEMPVGDSAQFTSFDTFSAFAESIGNHWWAPSQASNIQFEALNNGNGPMIYASSLGSGGNNWVSSWDSCR